MFVRWPVKGEGSFTVSKWGFGWGWGEGRWERGGFGGAGTGVGAVCCVNYYFTERVQTVLIVSTLSWTLFLNNPPNKNYHFPT